MTPRRLKRAILTGDRVLLRPLEVSDSEAAFSILHGTEEILRWLVWDGPEQVEDLRKFYCRWVLPGEDGDDYHFAIVERETGAFIGCIGPRFAGHPSTGDVGYWLSPACWGKGYMTESVLLVSHLCFRHLGAEVLYAYVFVGNEGSRSVLERNGYSLIHVSRAKVAKGGRMVDEWYLTLLRREFEERFGDYRPVEEEIEWEQP